VRNKGRFLGLSRERLLSFLITLSIFQPSVRAIHEDLGSNLLFEATDKTFLEEGIRHSLHSERKVFKGRYKFFHYSIFLQFGQMENIMGVSVKVVILLCHKLSQRNIPLACLSMPFTPLPKFWTQIEKTITNFG
jgi:hypothetical protein